MMDDLVAHLLTENTATKGYQKQFHIVKHFSAQLYLLIIYLEMINNKNNYFNWSSWR